MPNLTFGSFERRPYAMIHSMTGFGHARAEAASSEAEVRIRSVNHRHLDVVVRLPRVIEAREPDVHARIRRRFGRGRFDVRVHMHDSLRRTAVIDPATVRASVEVLGDIRRAAAINEPIRLDHVLHFKEIFRPPCDDESAAWEAADNALVRAMADLKAMRKREGDALRADLERNVCSLAGRLAEIEKSAPARIPRDRDRLRERLRKLGADTAIDEQRLLAEVALLADKLDVSEECVRLNSHVALFRETLATGGVVGRKLGFVVQEMGREVNTIGGKAHDAALSRLVVIMKEDLEKMREQIQNVE